MKLLTKLLFFILMLCFLAGVSAGAKQATAQTSPSVIDIVANPPSGSASGKRQIQVSATGNASYFKLYLHGTAAPRLTDPPPIQSYSPTTVANNTSYYLGNFTPGGTTIKFLPPVSNGTYWILANAERVNGNGSISGCDWAGQAYSRPSATGPVTFNGNCLNSGIHSFVAASLPTVPALTSVTVGTAVPKLVGITSSINATATNAQLIKLYIHDNNTVDLQKLPAQSYNPDNIAFKTFYFLGNDPLTSFVLPTKAATYRIMANAESAPNGPGDRSGCDWLHQTYIRYADNSVSYPGTQCTNSGPRSFNASKPSITSLTPSTTTPNAGAQLTVAAAGTAGTTWYYISKTRPSQMTSVAVSNTYTPSSLAANTFYILGMTDGVGSKTFTAPTTGGNYYLIANAHSRLQATTSPWPQYDRVCSWERKLFRWSNGAVATGETCINTPADTTTITITGTSTTATPTTPIGPTQPNPTNTGNPTVSPTPVCSVMPTALGKSIFTTSLAGGTYTVWTRMKAGSTTANSYFLQINQNCGIKVADINVPTNSWKWVDYRDGVETNKVTVTLPAGTHSVQLIGNEAAVQVDKLLFTDTSCTPTGLGDNCTGAMTPTPTGQVTATNTPGPSTQPSITQGPCGDNSGPTCAPTISVTPPCQPNTVNCPTPTAEPTPDCVNDNTTLCPTPTDGPTPTPTDIITPTVPITPTNLTPVPTIVDPCLSSQQCVSIGLDVGLHGIGSSGDNVRANYVGNDDPQTRTRTFEVTITDSDDQIYTHTTELSYDDDTSGTFTGTVNFPNAVPAGDYTILVKTDKYLARLLPGFKKLTKGQVVQTPRVNLIAGDIVNDNILNILDFNQLLTCYSGVVKSTTCQDIKAVDMTDDGLVDQFDYTLFLRELAVQSGQ